MYNYLSSTFPSVTVISEERSKDCDEVARPSATEDSSILEQVDSGWDVAVDPEHVTVWIDPLDATKEYTGNTQSNFSLVFGMGMWGRIT